MSDLKTGLASAKSYLQWDRDKLVARIAELEAEVARLSATTPMKLLRQRLSLAEKVCEAADGIDQYERTGAADGWIFWEERFQIMQTALAAWREGK